MCLNIVKVERNANIFVSMISNQARWILFLRYFRGIRCAKSHGLDTSSTMPREIVLGDGKTSISGVAKGRLAAGHAKA